nr:hypothetical protein [Tanacetum cinerariifolium]
MCGGMVDARKVFEEVTERDIVAYTSLISGYVKCEDCDSSYEAFDVVKVMVSDGMEPNRVTLASLLQVVGKLRVLDYEKLIHTYAIRRGIGCCDEVSETSLIDMYVKCGAPNRANAVFGQWSIKTNACWNVLIVGHLKSCQPFEALNLFSIMAKEGRRFELIALVNGILSCANLGLLRVGKSIHGYMFRTGVQLGVVTKTVVVDMYSKCDSCSKARLVFDTIKDKEIISYNVIMVGYHQNGHAHDAIEAFRNMRRVGLPENEAVNTNIRLHLTDPANQRMDPAVGESVDP